MQNLPPTQQFNYGGPPQDPFRPPSPHAHLGKSAFGNMDANAAGALAYISIVGIILLVMEKQNRFVRFHAMQSVLYGFGMSALIVVLFIGLWIIGFIFIAIAAAAGGQAGGAISAILALLIMLFWVLFVAVFPLAILGGLILAAVKAYQGQLFKLPIVGNLAERFTK